MERLGDVDGGFETDFGGVFAAVGEEAAVISGTGEVGVEVRCCGEVVERITATAIWC